MTEINYEVRDDFGSVAGWFMLDFDAHTFILAQTHPTRYSVVEVNKRVVEDN